MNIQPLKIASQLYTPAYFMVGDKDIMTLARKVKVMYEKYGASIKHYKTFEGEHASPRPVEAVENAAKFVQKLWELKKPKDYKEGILDGIDESVVIFHKEYENLTKFGDLDKPY